MASGGAVVTNVNDLRLAMFILEQDASEERMHFRSWMAYQWHGIAYAWTQ